MCRSCTLYPTDLTHLCFRHIVPYLKKFGKNPVTGQVSSRVREGGGGGPRMKRSGMLVIVLRGKNREFWYCLGC